MAEHKTTVTVAEAGNGPYVQTVEASNHHFAADEFLDLGGQDRGPAPYDFLLAALGSCTSITLRMYADQKKWPVEKIAVRLTHRKETGADGKKTDIITRDISVEGPLDDAQRRRLLEIADKCPVHRTLENKPVIESRPRMTPQHHIENVDKSAALIGNAAGAGAPKVAIILGSGLGGFAAKIAEPKKIAYKDLPGFPVLSVQGHAGEVVTGTLDGTPVIALNGRKHFYETDDPYPLKTMIRAVKGAGVKTLSLSNAAGSLRAHIGVSELMLITDHINHLGLNPLTGSNDEAFGPRFFSMSDAWDADLRRKIKDAAKKNGVKLHEGVYMAFRGPSFETPAEIRMAQAMGGDAVGMSSVPECIIARHCGLKVAGVSCITNMGAGLSAETLSHAHTLENAGKGAADFEKLVTAAVAHL